jgi:hypothetical protein
VDVLALALGMAPTEAEPSERKKKSARKDSARKESARKRDKSEKSEKKVSFLTLLLCRREMHFVLFCFVLFIFAVIVV